MSADQPTVQIGPFKIGEKPAPLLYTFLDSAGVPINLTGYTIKFVVRERDADTATTFSAVLSNAAGGVVQYSWVGTEFPAPGHYVCEFWAGNGAQRWASLTIEFAAATGVGPVPSI